MDGMGSHCEFVVKSKVRSCDRKNIFQYLCFICISSRRHISSCSVSNIQCSGAKMAHVHRNLNSSSTPHIPTHLNSPAGYPGIQQSESLGSNQIVLGSRPSSRIITWERENSAWKLGSKKPMSINETGSDMHGLCLNGFRSVTLW